MSHLYPSPQKHRTISAQTFAVADILAGLANIISQCEVLANEPRITGTAFAAELLFTVKRNKSALAGIKSKMSAASVEIINREIVEDEHALQMKCISDMLWALPKGIRDQADTHIAALYNVYALNKD